MKNSLSEVYGFGFRVGGFGRRVSGFEFWVSHLSRVDVEGGKSAHEVGDALCLELRGGRQRPRLHYLWGDVFLCARYPCTQGYLAHKKTGGSPDAETRLRL